MIRFVLSLLTVLLCFAGIVLAQVVPVVPAPPAIQIDPSDANGFFQIVWAAITQKNWWLVFALGVVLVTWALRTYGGKYKGLLWTQSDRGGAVLGMLTGGATTIALGLMAGKPLDLNLIMLALGGGTSVLGVFTLWKKGVLGGTKPPESQPPPASGA